MRILIRVAVATLLALGAATGAGLLYEESPSPRRYSHTIAAPKHGFFDGDQGLVRQAA
ncbi:MAG TPA: hypothetical protein VMB50_24375 [Myxococcales bacterium]|nr:hypothetical protein [Myxococcales bacterium]